MHTLNLSLVPDETGWTARSGKDRFLIVDDILLPLWALRSRGFFRCDRSDPTGNRILRWDDSRGRYPDEALRYRKGV